METSLHCIDQAAQSWVQRTLGRLSSMDGVQCALLVARDGLDVIGGEDLTAALAAAMYGAIERATGLMELGQLRSLLVETDTHHLLVECMDQFLLVALVELPADTMLIRRVMNRAVRKVHLY